METDRIGELQDEIKTLRARQNNIADLLIERGKNAVLLEKFDNIELQISELEEELRSAEIAGRHIPSREEIVEWFGKLKDCDECSEALMKQVINTFVHKVFLWDDKAVIVLTLANTEKTVTFEQIREWEMLKSDSSYNNDIGSPYWT